MFFSVEISAGDVEIIKKPRSLLPFCFCMSQLTLLSCLWWVIAFTLYWYFYISGQSIDFGFLVFWSEKIWFFFLVAITGFLSDQRNILFQVVISQDVVSMACRCIWSLLKMLGAVSCSSPGREGMLLYNSAGYYKDLKHKQYKI